MELKSWSGVWFAGWVVAASINSIFSDSLCKRAREKNLVRESNVERGSKSASLYIVLCKENEASKGETKKTMGGAGVKLLEKVINTTNIFQEPIIQKCSTNRVSRSRNLETTCCTTNLFRVLIFLSFSAVFISRLVLLSRSEQWLRLEGPNDLSVKRKNRMEIRKHSENLAWSEKNSELILTQQSRLRKN